MQFRRKSKAEIAIKSEKALCLEANGDIHIKADKNVNVKGKQINLN